MPSKSRSMSRRYMVTDSSLSRDEPASVRMASSLASACAVCSAIDDAASVPTSPCVSMRPACLTHLLMRHALKPGARSMSAYDRRARMRSRTTPTIAAAATDAKWERAFNCIFSSCAEDCHGKNDDVQCSSQLSLSALCSQRCTACTAMSKGVVGMRGASLCGCS
ncbi:unnamed protein product [Pelagomonas calceolata]|uniref:Uncharacterized protein n=1 Tax=Pelagomonas calceolata TaxID=35677 RepID=A0A8J2SF55_9STRA|nr:unnamed protein product [Pelagomonas calceolata]